MIHVIKIGGAVVDDQQQLQDVLHRCASLNAPFVLVHGGGRIATELAQQLNIPQTIVDGRRFTNAETLRIITMTYAGLINKNIVVGLQGLGVTCVGVCGADMNLITAKRREHPTVDFGYVGDIILVDSECIRRQLNSGVSLVIAPLTHDGKGQLLNTNADTIASEIATALAPDSQLTYLFDLPGVLHYLSDNTSVIPVIDSTQIDQLLADGTISSGMLPKISMALKAAFAGVPVRIQQTSDLGTERGTLVR